MHHRFSELIKVHKNSNLSNYAIPGFPRMHLFNQVHFIEDCSDAIRDIFTRKHNLKKKEKKSILGKLNKKGLKMKGACQL